MWLGLAGVLLGILIPAVPNGFERFLTEGGELPEGFDFVHYFQAAEAVAQGEHLYESYTGGYLYPPMLAVIIAPLTSLSIDNAAVIWYWANVVTAVVVVMWVMRYVRDRMLPYADPAVWEAGALIAVLAGFELVKRQASFAQTDGIAMTGLLLALPALMSRRPCLRLLLWAGLGIGFAANIKFMALGILPYLLLTRRWGIVGAAALGTVAISLSTSLYLGWERNLEYLAASSGGLLHVFGVEAESYGGFDPWPITWINSVSVTSGLARQFGEGEPMIIGAALVLLAWSAAAWWLYKSNGLSLLERVTVGGRKLSDAAFARIAVLEWSSVIAAILVFSPQTTKRHMLLFMPALVLTAMLLVARRSRPVWVWSLVSLLVLSGGLYLPPGSLVTDEVQNAWRSIGGAGWCLMASSLALLAAGLRDARPLIELSANEART